MQSVSSKIWTRVAVSISYDDNHYTTGTSFFLQPLRSGRIWHKVNFFNGMSTFVDYLMPNFIFVGKKWYCLTYCEGYDKEVHTLSKGIWLKVNLITTVEFELAYQDVAA